MGTPKKPVKNKAVSKSSGAKSPDDEPIDPKTKKKIIDDDDEDDEFDMPLDEIGGGYESFDAYDEDDDY